MFQIHPSRETLKLTQEQIYSTTAPINNMLLGSFAESVFYNGIYTHFDTSTTVLNRLTHYIEVCYLIHLTDS